MKTPRFKFSDIYEKYHEKLHRYLQRMVGTNDAEDLTQEVFVKIDNGLKDFQGKSSFATWVIHIPKPVQSSTRAKETVLTDI